MQFVLVLCHCRPDPLILLTRSNIGFVQQVNSGPFPAAPYYKGRFSNGRVWIEVVAAAFGQELQDLATGNAITGAAGEAPGMFMVQPPFANTTSPTPVLVPSALDQVSLCTAWCMARSCSWETALLLPEDC